MVKFAITPPPKDLKISTQPPPGVDVQPHEYSIKVADDIPTTCHTPIYKLEHHMCQPRNHSGMCLDKVVSQHIHAYYNVSQGSYGNLNIPFT